MHGRQQLENASAAGEHCANTPSLRRLLALIAVAAIGLFAIANRGAYQNYFQADSIDNLALSQALDARDLVQPLLVPRVLFNNFRPVGMLFFKLMGQWFGLWFPPYAAALQLLHIVNAILLVWLMRRLQVPLMAACAGAVFFAVHMALFSVHWEPMYVFDLLCGSLSLLSLIAYIDGRWIVSLALFWLAYRAKENAVMLPAILAGYELLLGRGRWKRLIPFFALSLALGVQALINNSARQSDYTLRFDPASIWQCMRFYSGEILLVPFAGFAALLLLLVRDRRSWFGVLCFAAFIAPLLALPGRLAAAYLYVPLMGLAIGVGVLAERRPKAVIAAVLLAWIPWNFVNLRQLRNAELARAGAARIYIANTIKAARQYPAIDTYIYHDIPMPWYGITAAVQLVHRRSENVKALRVDDDATLPTLQSPSLVLLDWEPVPPPGSVVTLARTPQTPDLSYIKLDRSTPLWQLERGFNLGDRGPYRWIGPSAVARLSRPPGAKRFKLAVNATDALFKYVPRTHLRILIDGHLIGQRDFDREGVEVLRWNLDAAPSGTVRVDFEVQPGFRVDAQGELYGLNIGSFGFIP